MQQIRRAASAAQPPLNRAQLAARRPDLAPTPERFSFPRPDGALAKILTQHGREPRIKLSRLENQGGQDVWELALEGAVQASQPDPPIARYRLLPKAGLDTGRGTTVAAGRPRGSDQLYVPRIIPKARPRMLRRFNGSKLRALDNQEFLLGDNNRQVISDTSYPWRCVGKIFFTDTDGTSHWGSAALISRNAVVTASHVVPWGDSALRAPLRFVPSFFDTDSLLGTGVGAWVTDAEAWEFIQDDVVGYDMAVCRLDQPLGDTLGWFGAKGFDDSWEDGDYWNVVGYPYDIAGGSEPVWEGGVSVVDDDSDDHQTLELETHADIASGNSGGPLFGFWDDAPYNIGVCSGNEREYTLPFSFNDENNVFAGGHGLIQLIRWARDNWP